jgi:hypothetical protein
MLDERYDGYDQVLMLDMDMVATEVYEDAFARPEIGVLHDRAMQGTSKTPAGGPGLYKKGAHVFFGNFVKFGKAQRTSLRRHLDIPMLEQEIVNPYTGDEIALHYLLYQSGILDGLSYEDVCMRCSGTSPEDICFRDHNRYDRVFCNMRRDCDKNASLVHFIRNEKKDILDFLK